MDDFRPQRYYFFLNCANIFCFFSTKNEKNARFIFWYAIYFIILHRNSEIAHRRIKQI